MDIASWELYEAIRDGCFRITLILILQTDSNEDMKVHSQCRSTFDRIWHSANMEDNRVIDLPNLTKNTLELMLLHNAKKYKESYEFEANRMTTI